VTAETSNLDVYTLTPAGWPRPRYNGWPIPWVSPREKLSEMNEGRRLAGIGGAVCNVCGLDFAWGEHGFAFVAFTLNGEHKSELPLDYGAYVTELDPIQPADEVTLLDGAVMHYRCAKLAASTCPHIVGRTDLVCVEVPANDADVKDDAGKLIPVYPAGDVRYVAWPTPR
jgi:hypothetical protein